MNTQTPPPRFRGNIHLFFCFELAYGVNVDTLERLLATQVTEGVISMRRSKSHYLRFESLPLIVRLGEEKVRLRGETRPVPVLARVFDFGVLSLRFTLPFDCGFAELVALSAEISDGEPFHAPSLRCLRRIKGIVSPALYRPIESDLMEDYTVFHVTGSDEPFTGREFLDRHGREVAMILRGEELVLSDQETSNALSNSISYYPGDVLVVDWDRAFVYDKEEHTDHIHIIEFANTQLLDMRYFDRWLDGELDTLAREVYAEGARGPILGGAGVRKLSKRTMALMTDVIWLTDEIDNSLKAIDTLYAARVHRAIAARLYLAEWKRGLDRKLAALREMSDTLTMRVYSMRSTVIELAIVILILIELFVAILGPGVKH